jgi:galactosyl transferase GMA12/MNN10 family
MKALCSIGAGPHAALLEISRPTFADYARRHGYELITSTESDPARPPAWAKVPMLREAVDDYERVLWIDADAVIVDGESDIAAELEPERDLALVRHRRGDESIPNTGVMLMRGGDFARELLDALWASKRFVHHPWWENAALLDLFGYDLPGELDPSLRGYILRLTARLRGRPLRRLTLVRPSPFLAQTQFLPPEWNSVFPDLAEHPRIVHFPGVPVEERMRAMSDALRI